jgi:hypothetical protein
LRADARVVALGTTCWLAVGVASASAEATVARTHPRVTATVLTQAAAKTLVVRVSDRVTRKPVTHAKVTAAGEMHQPHVMIFPPLPLHEGPRGSYRSRYDFLMAGLVVTIRVSGPGIFPVAARFKTSATTPPVLTRIVP